MQPQKIDFSECVLGGKGTCMCKHMIIKITTPLEQRYYTAKSFQSCPTLCNPIDGSPPGSPIPGILQARTLEWVAIAFSNAWKWKVKVKSLSHVRLLATPWTAAYQAPPSMGFSRQEYWSGVPPPSPVITLKGSTTQTMATATSYGVHIYLLITYISFSGTLPMNGRNSLSKLFTIV